MALSNNFLTINPLLPLLARSGTTFSGAELCQITERIQQELPGATGRHHARLTTYLKYLVPAVQKFGGVKQGALRDLNQFIDSGLLAGEYSYYSEKRPPAYKNTFWPEETARAYDLAFFHPESSRARLFDFHHRSKKEDISVFFGRLEFSADGRQLLLGNLQIDDREPTGWSDPAKAQLLLRRPTTERTMLTSLLRHAYKRAPAELLLQAGDAVWAAQFNSTGVRRVLITPKNYSAYAEKHAQRVADFGKLSPGDIIGYPGQQPMFVYARTPTEVKFYHDEWYSTRNLYERCFCGLFVKHPEQYALEQKMFTALQDRAVPRLQAAIHEFWKLSVAGVSLPEDSAAEQKFLSGFLAEIKTVHSVMLARLMNQYIMKFDLRHAILAAYPHIKAYPVNQGFIYLDTRQAKRFHAQTGAVLKPPVLGQYYNDFSASELSEFPELFYNLDHRFRVFSWYEYDLPRWLTRLGLQYTRVPITTRRRGTAVTAHAWKITAGLPELAAAPLPVF